MSWFAPHNLGMHRTCVFGLRQRESGRFWIQSHSAFGARSRSNLVDFGTHRTNVGSFVFRGFLGGCCGCRFGSNLVRWLRSVVSCHSWQANRDQWWRHWFRRSGENSLRICLELCETTVAAEEVLLSCMIGLEASGCALDLHAANWIARDARVWLSCCHLFHDLGQIALGGIPPRIRYSKGKPRIK